MDVGKDKGDPAEAYDDPDGSHNMGAYGGPDGAW